MTINAGPAEHSRRGNPTPRIRSRNVHPAGGPVQRIVSGGGGFIIKGSPSACSLQRSGRTCCGREERCAEPRCEGET